jgi:hypothetical protein
MQIGQITEIKIELLASQIRAKQAARQSKTSKITQVRLASACHLGVSVTKY